MDISIIDAIEIYQAQYGMADSLWKYFATVSLAVLGFTVGSEKATHSRLEISAIQIAYLIFSIGALFALVQLQGDLLTYKEWIDELSASLGPDSPNIAVSPNSRFQIVLYFVSVLAAALLAIEITFRQRRRDSNRTEI